jgi:hypothetical protein
VGQRVEVEDGRYHQAEDQYIRRGGICHDDRVLRVEDVGFHLVIEFDHL